MASVSTCALYMASHLTYNLLAKVTLPTSTVLPPWRAVVRFLAASKRGYIIGYARGQFFWLWASQRLSELGLRHMQGAPGSHDVGIEFCRMLPEVLAKAWGYWCDSRYLASYLVSPVDAVYGGPVPCDVCGTCFPL